MTWHWEIVQSLTSLHFCGVSALLSMTLRQVDCIVCSACCASFEWNDFIFFFLSLFVTFCKSSLSIARDDIFSPINCHMLCVCGSTVAGSPFFIRHSVRLPHTDSGTHRCQPWNAGHQWWLQQDPDRWGAAGSDKTLLSALRVVPESPDPNHWHHTRSHLPGPGTCCQLPQTLSQL